MCKYRVGRLKLRRIIFSEYGDAGIEIFGNECNRIKLGIGCEIYASAKFFVDNTNFDCYSDLDDNKKMKQMIIAKVCEIMAWQDQNLGFMNMDEKVFWNNQMAKETRKIKTGLIWCRGCYVWIRLSKRQQHAL